MIGSIISLESEGSVCVPYRLLHISVEVVRDAMYHFEMLHVEFWRRNWCVRVSLSELPIFLACIIVGEGRRYLEGVANLATIPATSFDGKICLLSSNLTSTAGISCQYW